MKVQGHTQILDATRTALPHVSIFSGPYSVGKWTTAEHLRWYHNVSSVDTTRVRNTTSEDVEWISSFALSAPVSSKFRLVLVDTYNLPFREQDKLVQVTEESKTSRFIFVGTSESFSPRLLARGVVFRFGYLTADEVFTVLTDKMNMTPSDARKYADRSGGQVYSAIRASEDNPTLSLVVQATSALRSHDEELLLSLATRWNDEATSLLVQWCHESIIGREGVFEEKDLAPDRSLPIRVLAALVEGVRPKLVVRAQLLSVLKEK